jgi:hypothetical protein
MRVPAFASGLAILGGVAVRQLGIELERAWMRSYSAPMLGDPVPAESLAPTQPAHSGQTAATIGRHRRWITNHHPTQSVGRISTPATTVQARNRAVSQRT